MVSLLLLKWLIFVLMATGIRGPVICGAPTVVSKLPVKYGRTKNNTKNGDKNVIKNTYLFKKYWYIKHKLKKNTCLFQWKTWNPKLTKMKNKNHSCFQSKWWMLSEWNIILNQQWNLFYQFVLFFTSFLYFHFKLFYSIKWTIDLKNEMSCMLFYSTTKLILNGLKMNKTHVLELKMLNCQISSKHN